MTVDQVTEIISKMSIEDKISLFASLRQAIKIDEKENKYQQMINKYVGTMKKLVGDAFLIGKKRTHVQGKVILANCLMEDGCTLTTASHIIGVDHSTVSHYKKVWETAIKYPKIYSDVISLYNKYREELCQQ